MVHQFRHILTASALVASIAIGFQSARGQAPAMGSPMPGNTQPMGYPAQGAGQNPPSQNLPGQYPNQQPMQPQMQQGQTPNMMPPQQAGPGYPTAPYGQQPQMPNAAPIAPMQQQGSGFPSAPPQNVRVIEERFVPSVVETVLPPPQAEGETLALLKTSMGEITIHLFTGQQPMNTATFIELAKGTREFTDVNTGKKVRRPFYNGLIFHRVLKGFLIQTGCPYGTGRGGPGFTTRSEFTPSLKFNKPGLVAFAPPRNERGELQKDANGSQFFITLAPQPELDDKATIIGEVTKGMDIVEAINKVPTGPTDRPVRRVHLISVEIQTGGA